MSHPTSPGMVRVVLSPQPSITQDPPGIGWSGTPGVEMSVPLTHVFCGLNAEARGEPGVLASPVRWDRRRDQPFIKTGPLLLCVHHTVDANLSSGTGDELFSFRPQRTLEWSPTTY